MLEIFDIGVAGGTVVVMGNLSSFCCLNEQCPDFGKRGVGNLSVTHRYGTWNTIRLLRCSTCKGRFSERKGTPFFHSHLRKKTSLSILHHVNEGCGVRQTARLVEVHHNTVTRYSRLAGLHAEAAHAELVGVSPPDARGSVRREARLRL